MKLLLTFIIFLVIYTNSFAQATDTLPELERTIKVTDPFYREDQFYIGLTHTMLSNQPDNLNQRSISIGANFGFLRDFPINKQRTFSLAPGFGFALYNLRTNMLQRDNNPVDFVFDNNPDQNVQKLSYLEIPIEIRWRTSKVHSHKFWRIYSGLKFSYLLNSTSKYNGTLGSYNFKNKDIFEKYNVGMYVSAGFNTWNFYAYYGFNPLMKSNNTVNNNRLQMINLGLMFYIL